MKRNLILLLSLVLLCLPVAAQKKKKPVTGKEPLFGKALATYTVTSNELAGATFYLVAVMADPTREPSVPIRDTSFTKTSMLTTLCSAWGVNC